MQQNSTHSVLSLAGKCAFLLGYLLFPSLFARGETHTVLSPQSSATALMLSDIHFEPFWDPGKTALLAAAPVTEWNAILATAPSPDQPQRFAALQQACHARGSDTSDTLFQSSLKALHSHSGDAKFATVSGDLLAHAFQCKFKTVFPHAPADAYRAFAEKTLEYVLDQLNGALAGLPVYVALGNNDSDCGDYQLDPQSEFLALAGKQVTRNFPAQDRQAAAESFAKGGYYSVSLPAPIAHARLLVLNDLFLSGKYKNCAGQSDSTPTETQLAWLKQQLNEARHNQEKIWVMAHIPPGVDLHATVTRFDDVCGGQGPESFLASDKLASLLADSGDVVQLAIFAHTHMDELRLLKPEDSPAATAKGVPVKLVASISPINGNSPSFTVAELDSATASLLDYRLFTASNLTGLDAKWSEAYDFARSYHQTAFTASAVAELVAGFAADPAAMTQASRNYIQDFSTGYLSPVLAAFWPQYVCSLSNHSAAAFRSCVCPAKASEGLVK